MVTARMVRSQTIGPCSNNGVIGDATDGGPDISVHAHLRMRQRGIRHDAVALALRCGRRYLTKGAEFYTLGRREKGAIMVAGFDPKKLEGISVVCDPRTREIITVYRWTDFRRGRGKRRRAGLPGRGSI
jgi:hypothetical protein